MPGGRYFYDISGDIFPLGLNADGSFPYGSIMPVLLPQIDTNTGTYYNVTYDCSMWMDTISDGPDTYSVRECVDPSDLTHWGICFELKSSNSSTAGFTSCSPAAFLAIEWPENNAGTFIFQNGVGYFSYVLNPPTNAYNQSFNSLVIPGPDLSINLKIDIRQIVVAFTSSDIVPIIDELEDKGDSILITAHSEVGEGHCLFLSENDIFNTLDVKLKFTEQVFKLPISRSEFSGVTNIILKCYEKEDTVKFNLQIKKKDVNINEESIVEPEIREASIKKSIGQKIGLFFAAPFQAIAGARLLIADYLWWAVFIYLLIMICVLYLIFKCWRYYRKTPLNPMSFLSDRFKKL